MSTEKNKLVLRRGYGSKELLSDFCSGPFVNIDFNVENTLKALNDTLLVCH